MTTKISSSADGLSGSLAVGALEALGFKPVGGGLELSQDGTVFQTVDADGKVAFPQQGQLFNAAGYVKLPGGLIVQWGGALLSTGSANTWAGGTQPLPIPFPTACLRVLGNVTAVSGLSAQNIVGNASIHGTTPLTTVSVAALSGTGAVANIPISFIAIGY